MGRGKGYRIDKGKGMKHHIPRISCPHKWIHIETRTLDRGLQEKVFRCAYCGKKVTED